MTASIAALRFSETAGDATEEKPPPSVTKEGCKDTDTASSFDDGWLVAWIPPPGQVSVKNMLSHLVNLIRSLPVNDLCARDVIVKFCSGVLPEVQRGEERPKVEYG